MGVPDEDLPRKARPLVAGQAGGRRPNTGLGSHSNRPILLEPRSDLPDSDDDEDLDEEDSELREAIRNAPAWLVSTVFHMLLLILLGIWAFSVRSRDAELEVEVSYAEDLGEQLLDPSMLESSGLELDTIPENIITPPNLTPIDDPLAAPPELVDLRIDLPATMATVDQRPANAAIGHALDGRKAGTRAALLKKYGGTAETERAVEMGLAWLVKQQRPDGSWSMTGPYENQSPYENDVAATAMALLAFQGHGDTHLEGQYTEVVAKGWDALLKLQRPDGQFLGNTTMESHIAYGHAQAAIAVCELYGMTKDPKFREPAERVLRFSAKAQDPKLGGWRYRPRIDSDTSVTGWYVMAFQSARMAGLSFPSNVLPRVMTFLDKVEIDDGRGYRYQINKETTHAVSAEGLLCRQYLGWRQNDQRLVDGVSWLVENVPIKFDNSQDIYYWYYCTQAAHHMEGQIWEDWNDVMRQALPEKQVKEGPEAGSWDPGNDKFAWGGRLYVTCLSIYMLEVYYRHLPIYSGYQFVDAEGKTMDPAAAPLPAKTEAGDEPSATAPSGAPGDAGAPPIDPIELPSTNATPRATGSR